MPETPSRCPDVPMSEPPDARPREGWLCLTCLYQRQADGEDPRQSRMQAPRVSLLTPVEVKSLR